MSNNQNQTNQSSSFNKFSQNVDPIVDNSNQPKTGDNNKQKQNDDKPKPADDTPKKS